MPDTLTDSDVGLSGTLTDSDVGLGGSLTDADVGIEADNPDLTKLKLSPYEQADIASFAAGKGKAETGMEPGTELTTAMAGGALKAAAAVPPTLQSIADIPTRIAKGVGMARGNYADMPAVGEERKAQAEGFGEAMQKPIVPLDLFKAKVEKDDPAWAPPPFP
ncbi:MAG TPA: hypothetical protein VMQ76_09645, partial [Terracidiphilus sp.]|nr:hypothetical protein [Terracidiphilus sp.]